MTALTGVPVNYNDPSGHMLAPICDGDPSCLKAVVQMEEQQARAIGAASPQGSGANLPPALQVLVNGTVRDLTNGAGYVDTAANSYQSLQNGLQAIASSSRVPPAVRAQANDLLQQLEAAQLSNKISFSALQNALDSFAKVTGPAVTVLQAAFDFVDYYQQTGSIITGIDYAAAGAAGAAIGAAEGAGAGIAFCGGPEDLPGDLICGGLGGAAGGLLGHEIGVKFTELALGALNKLTFSLEPTGCQTLNPATRFLPPGPGCNPLNPYGNDNYSAAMTPEPEPGPPPTRPYGYQ